MGESGSGRSVSGGSRKRGLGSALGQGLGSAQGLGLEPLQTDGNTPKHGNSSGTYSHCHPPGNIYLFRSPLRLTFSHPPSHFPSLSPSHPPTLSSILSLPPLPGTASGEYSPFMSNKKARGKAAAGSQGLPPHPSGNHHGMVMTEAKTDIGTTCRCYHIPSLTHTFSHTLIHSHILLNSTPSLNQITPPPPPCCCQETT